MTTKKTTKDTRIKAEETRLRAIYKNLHEDKLSAVDGLIMRAAYMRATLEDYEADMNINGYVEQFSQSDKLDPYERGRPVVGFYNTMNKNYQSIMKQLTDLLPKTEPVEKDDGFDDFVNGRDD